MSYLLCMFSVCSVPKLMHLNINWGLMKFIILMFLKRFAGTLNKRETLQINKEGALPRLPPSPASPRSDLRPKQTTVTWNSLRTEHVKAKWAVNHLYVIQSLDLLSAGPILFVLTIKAVECFAVADDGQRVIVVKLVIELVWVRVQVSGLWRPGTLMRCVMLLTGVFCVTALRAAQWMNERFSMTSSTVINTLHLYTKEMSFSLI